MIESATGIILRTRPLRETSVIVQWLTPEFGRIATVAKAARVAKSPFRGKLDLFFECDFSFNRSRSSELHTLREVALRETNTALRNDIHLLQQAAYCARLVEQTTETETPLRHVFDLMCKFVGAIPKQPPQAQTVFAFELKMLNELGLTPDMAKSQITPGAKQIISSLLKNDFDGAFRLKLTAAQVTELRQFLHGFLIFHLGKLPTGRMQALGISE